MLGLFSQPGYCAEPETPIFVATNSKFGANPQSIVILRAILLGRSKQSPTGSRITLILPESREQRMLIFDKVGISEWQVEASWGRDNFAEGGKIHLSDPAGGLHAVESDAGAFYVMTVKPSIPTPANVRINEVTQ